jgi:hypothetical protein
MQTEVELLRALIYRAAEALVAGEDVTRLATMAKLKAGRLGRELTTPACSSGRHGLYERDAGEPGLSRQPPDLDRRRRRRGDADRAVQDDGHTAEKANKKTIRINERNA